MSIQIEIKDDEIKDLIEFYSIKQRTLREQISKLEKNLRDITASISQLKHLATLPHASKGHLLEGADIFSPNWPWVRKIAFAIREAGKPISTKEIVELLNVYEARSEEEKRSAISSVSSTLTVKSGKYSDKRAFIKNISSSGEYVYDIWKEINTGSDLLDDGSNDYGSDILMDGLPF